MESDLKEKLKKDIKNYDQLKIEFEKLELENGI